MMPPLFLIFMVSREQSTNSGKPYMKISPYDEIEVHLSFFTFTQEGEET